MNRINDNIKTVRIENEYIVLGMEEIFYLTELLEEFNKDYIHKHYDNRNDEIWILSKDYKGNLQKQIGDINRTWVCKKCDCEVVFDKELVSKNYDCACLNCDEDLYNHEISLIPNERVIKFRKEIEKI